MGDQSFKHMKKLIIYILLVLSAIVGSIVAGNAQPQTEKVYLHVYNESLDLFCGEDEVTVFNSETVYDITTSKGSLKLEIIKSNFPYMEYLCKDENDNEYTVRHVVNEARGGKGIMFIPADPNRFTFFIANIPNCEKK